MHLLLGMGAARRYQPLRGFCLQRKDLSRSPRVQATAPCREMPGAKRINFATTAETPAIFLVKCIITEREQAQTSLLASRTTRVIPAELKKINYLMKIHCAMRCVTIPKKLFKWHFRTCFQRSNFDRLCKSDFFACTSVL